MRRTHAIHAATSVILGLALTSCGGSSSTAYKQLIERDLVDPQSVQYRDVKSYGDGTVCGEFNAKNRMGGYAGFQQFTYFRNQLLSEQKYRAALCSNEKNKDDSSSA